MMRITFWIVLAFASASLARPATAVELLSENFDSVALGAPVDETGTGFNDNAWSATPPAGWTSDPRTTPAGGISEWFGWTFANPEFWVAADDQQRSQFSLGQGVIAVADPDEYDDGDIDVDPDLYTSVLSSPSVDVSDVVPGSNLTLTFDSSWRPEDAQAAAVNAVFDTGSVNVLNWSSDSASPDFKADATNETVMLEFAVPDGASSLSLEFDMPQGGNDWWWAIDNVVLDGELVPEPASASMILVGLLGLLGLRQKR